MNQPETPSLDLVTALGRLLSSPSLREEFKHCPENVADRLSLVPSCRAAFLALSVDDLNRQAETLIRKRWHEVQRLAPRTIGNLGDDAEGVFQFYASTNWPEGHRRHLIDAFRFLQFLDSNGIIRPDRGEIRRLKNTKG